MNVSVQKEKLIYVAVAMIPVAVVLINDIELIRLVQGRMYRGDSLR